MYNRLAVFSAACLGMLIFGIVLTTIGALLPLLIPKFNIDKIDAGSLMSFLSIGILLGSLVFGPFADRYGFKLLLIIATFFTLIGLLSIALTKSFLILRISTFFIGFGGGILNGATNALVADISAGERSAGLSLLGVFFGMGAIGIPFLLGLLLEYITYETFISIVGILVIIPIIFFIAIRFPNPKHKEGFPLKEGFTLLKSGVLLVLGLILFFESGMEITVSSWAAIFLHEEIFIEQDRSIFLLSFFWLGLTLTRFFLGIILKSVSPIKIFILSLLIAIVGVSVMITSSGTIGAIVGLFLIGSGFAAGFPVILGMVGDLYAELSGTAFSIVFVIALVGGSTIPFLTGIIAQLYQLRISLLIIPACIIIMLLLLLAIRKKIPQNI
jgi:FHS family glucose/mannose:H+ symporter-like MFS transporter